MPEAASILIAADIVSDAELVREILEREFDNIAISTDPKRAVEDFESRRPGVLILAFNTLEKAESYYLGLYRLSDKVHAMPHHTLILCHRTDLKRVYELCKKEYFDDYILFWPVPDDAMRLPMTVHHALRQVADDSSPTAGELAGQARQLFELMGSIEQHSSAGERHVEQAAESVRHAETELLAALDGFYSRLTTDGSQELVEVRDSAGLAQEFSHLRKEGIEKPFKSVDAAVQPMREWAGSLKSELAPQLESTRVLQDLAMRVRPVVLVVDDDEFQHKLLARVLADEHLELVFATNGAEALQALRRHRPELILMDVCLPGEDGVEVTRRIKSIERFAAIPLVMVTGKGEKSIVFDSMKAGAADFVVKPFNKKVLVMKVRKILSRQ